MGEKKLEIKFFILYVLFSVTGCFELFGFASQVFWWFLNFPLNCGRGGNVSSEGSSAVTPFPDLSISG